MRFLSLLGTVCIFLSLSIVSYSTADQLYIYKGIQHDGPKHKVLWVPSGWMPDGQGINFNKKYTDNCYSKNSTCLEIGFSAAQANVGWAGIYWLPLRGKTGSWQGPGINVYDKLGINKTTSVKLTFWARGKDGNERINFKVGGVGEGDDSIKFALETGWKTLEKTWTKYEIPLTDGDLSKVVGAFCWVASEEQNPDKTEVWFYLDEIKFEKVK